MRRLLVFVVLLGCGRTQGLDDRYASDDFVDADGPHDAFVADEGSMDTGGVTSLDASFDSRRTDANATLDASACLARPVVCIAGTLASMTLREIGNACDKETEGGGYCAWMTVEFDSEGCATALTNVTVLRESFSPCVARRLSEVRFGCIRGEASPLIMPCGIK